MQKPALPAVKKTARNPYKTVFKYKTWGGMSMATIGVHKDDFGTGKLEDDKKMGWKNIRVEVCVGGNCIGTTLDKIVDPTKALVQREQ